MVQKGFPGNLENDYTTGPVNEKTFPRKPHFLENQMCARVASVILANHYGLAYQAITRRKYLVSEGVTPTQL